MTHIAGTDDNAPSIIDEGSLFAADIALGVGVQSVITSVFRGVNSGNQGYFKEMFQGDGCIPY